MADRRKLLVLSEHDDGDDLLHDLSDRFEIVQTASLPHGLAMLRGGEFAGVFADTRNFEMLERGGVLIQANQVLDAIADGVALVSSDLEVLWANRGFLECVTRADEPGPLDPDAGRAALQGLNFYTALGSPDILGPDYCPFTTAMNTGQAASSVLRRSDNRFFRLTATPVMGPGGQKLSYIISLTHDITREMQQQQKIGAIHAAGSELANLGPEELAEMSVTERIELLKSNIVQHMRDLLNLDYIEIRLLDPATGRLKILLSEGITAFPKDRPLVACREGNGVTGFVAATGQSYLCHDTRTDPLYLQGAPDARSSLTVPLILHDQVIGTLNVESPKHQAFTESDQQFLEVYARDIALALNTLELLLAEKLTTATASVERISSAVALPVDEILADATWIIDRYIGHEPEMGERLRHILDRARDIKQVIQRVGEDITPPEMVTSAGSLAAARRPENHKLRERRILLIDHDENVRQAAHALLGRYRCVVETAGSGEEALALARLSKYDVVIADIRLPDMNGITVYRRMREVQPGVPVVLMTGFGYDPGHSIVQARQEGLRTVLYKPFRLDRLIETIEQNLAP